MTFPQVNWLAVVVAALAPFAIGSLWYGPLFVKPWMALTGINRNTPGQNSLALTFGGAAVVNRMKLTLCLGFIALQLVLVLVLAERAAFAADEDKFLGTWVLNIEKSKAPQGAMPTSATVVISKTGPGTYKSVSDTSLAGISSHSEIAFATDGKDYSPVVTPAPPPGTPAVTQSFERVSAAAYKGAVKLGGEVIATVLNEVSADGKTLTITTTGVGPAANVVIIMVCDRK